MAAFPTSITPVLALSSEEWMDDLTVDRAVGGGSRVRAFYPAKKRRLSLGYVLDATGRTTLETFYDTNRVLVFTIVSPFDSVTRNMLFATSPKFPLRYAPSQAPTTVLLVEQ